MKLIDNTGLSYLIGKIKTMIGLKADKTYVDNKVKTDVPLNAKFTDTVYTHPANHPPSIITQDANNRFVTDTEKAAWSGKADKTYVDNNLEQLDILNEKIDDLMEEVGNIYFEPEITKLDLMYLKSEYERIETERNQINIVLKNTDDSEFSGFEGSIDEYKNLTIQILTWLYYAFNTDNIDDINIEEWNGIRSDYLESLIVIYELISIIELKIQNELTSKMSDLEQIQESIAERFVINEMDLTIDFNNNKMIFTSLDTTLSINGVESIKYTSDGFVADKGRVDELRVGAHIISKDVNTATTIWRPI